MKNKLENTTCNICGESINTVDNFCSSCGAPLVKPVHINDTETSIVNNKATKNKIETKGVKNLKGEAQLEQKRISPIKIFYLTFFFIISALIIVYSSGSFDNPGVAKSTGSNVEDVHKGVDLQYIQRINALEEELKVNPDSQKLLELAHLLNDSGLKEKAIEKYKIYLKTNPKDADVLVDLGVCFFELGKNEDALRYMKEALKYQSQHQIAHLNLGIVSLSAGLHDEAIVWWKKAVALNPGNSIGKRAQELINSH